MALQPVVVRAPGFGGLNLEGEDIVADASFARVAKNLVFDKAGRLASRKGYSNINNLVGSNNVKQIFVYDYSGGDFVISALQSDLYEDTNDRTGALTPSDDQWQFQNFDDKVIGAQLSESIIVKSGTGNFAAVTPNGGGSVPNGNCIHSAFGRLWTTTNAATVLHISALLDETTWQTSTTTTDSFSVNMLGTESAVRSGFDKIVAINHLEDKIVVFMENSIVIFDSPEDPANLAIWKTINNIGCIARDSVQQVGNDLVFLSRDGLRSLQRSTIEDNFPLRDLSRHVRTELLDDISGAPEDVKGMYYPEEGIYILLMTGDTAWVFDFKRVFEDGLPRVTTWDVPNWHSLYYHEGTLYIGWADGASTSGYGQYSGYTEDGAAYQIEYKSQQIDFDSPNTKVMKKTTAHMEGGDAQVVQFRYEWDYMQKILTESVSFKDESTAGVYGTDSYGTMVYGDGVNRAKLQVNPGGFGEVLSFGFSAFVNGILLAVEQISHFVTLGRLSR